MGWIPAAPAPGETLKDVRFEPLRTSKRIFLFNRWIPNRLGKTRRRLHLRAWPPAFGRNRSTHPLNAVVHGLVDRPEYTVERVLFESIPGHFVTGSLYRPKPETHPVAARDGKRPVVLCPHGHWNDGRFHDQGEAAARREIAIGSERFEHEGRFPLQARCVQLARMGCIVFHYDMEGYADSVQLAHRTDTDTPLNTPERWGFFSTRAEAHLQNKMGLQSWNSIRAIDFVTSLPGVDPTRIAVTGASGGGTQTFMLGALDDRPAVLFPAVMVSTAMQGGCTCENAPLLRIGAGNIDLAARSATALRTDQRLTTGQRNWPPRASPT